MVRALSSKYTNRTLHHSILHGDPNNIFNEKNLDISVLNEQRKAAGENQYALACVIKPEGNNLFLCRLQHATSTTKTASNYDGFDSFGGIELRKRSFDQSSPTQPASNASNANEDEERSTENIVEGLMELPPKFRNFLWIKRGNYVVVELWPRSNIKIIGSILHLLRSDQLASLRKRHHQLPSNDIKQSTGNQINTATSGDGDDYDGSESDHSLLAPNPNHYSGTESDDDDDVFK
jgi:probable RNA-binding protein EIF1AD